MEIYYSVYSNYYKKWFTPKDNFNQAQFVFRSGRLVCQIWGEYKEKYDIVEVLTEFVPTPFSEIEEATQEAVLL